MILIFFIFKKFKTYLYKIHNLFKFNSKKEPNSDKFFENKKI